MRATLERRGSTVVLAMHRGETMAYIADEDSRALHLVSVDNMRRVGKTSLPGVPAQALMLADGRVAVALRDRSSVIIMEPEDDPKAPLATLCETAVPAEAWGLAVTPDDSRLLVTSAWGASLSVLDGTTLALVNKVSLPREPRAVVASDDGRRAFVSHAIGARVSVVDLLNEKSAPRVVKLGLRGPDKPKDDPARDGGQGFALAKAVIGPTPKEYAQIPGAEGPGPINARAPVLRHDQPIKKPAPAPSAPLPDDPRAPEPPAPVLKDRIYIPMATVDPGNPFERTFAYYGRDGRDTGPLVAEPMVGVIDGFRERSLGRDLFAKPNNQGPPGCVLPRAAAVFSPGETLLVACLGIDSILELDARGADPMRMEMRRWTVPPGPTGIAIDPGNARAVVWSQFAAKISVIELGAKESPSFPIEVDSTPPKDAVEMMAGREIFHRSSDANISSNGLACASCHPDGRDDGLTWSTSNGPRQTLMLAGRMHKTAPYGWRGQQPDINAYLGHTIARLGGVGLSDDRLVSLAAYVENVPPPPVPTGEVDPARASMIAWGRDLFFNAEQGCATCHAGGRGTDGARHDVGSVAQADDASDFDTPALRFIGRTGPYFHDGRYATLADLLASKTSGMGNSSRLNDDDRAALQAYLESL